MPNKTIKDQSATQKQEVKPNVFTRRIGRGKLLQPLLTAAKWFLLCLLVIYIPLAATAWVSDWRTSSDQYAAILLSADAFSGHDHWLPPLAFLGSYPAWTFYFNSKGLKTDYIFSATADDFIRVICNDRYQSIVVVGHGSRSHWKATDRDVSIYDIGRLRHQFKRKSGEWFQLTCGHREFSDVYLGDLVMKSRTTYAYADQAGMIPLIIDALVPFRIIKSETRYRLGSRIPG